MALGSRPLPGDPDNVLRDDLVFADGVMHLVSVGLDFSFDVDSRTCLATFLAHQTGTVEGGTRLFAGASGQFTGTVNTSSAKSLDSCSAPGRSVAPYDCSTCSMKSFAAS